MYFKIVDIFAQIPKSTEIKIEIGQRKICCFTYFVYDAVHKGWRAKFWVTYH